MFSTTVRGWGYYPSGTAVTFFFLFGGLDLRAIAILIILYSVGLGGFLVLLVLGFGFGFLFNRSFGLNRGYLGV
jgi:hypothetical protein